MPTANYPPTSPGPSTAPWRILPTLFLQAFQTPNLTRTLSLTLTLSFLPLLIPSHTHSRNARLAFAINPPPLIPPYRSLCVVAVSRDHQRGFQERLVSPRLTFFFPLRFLNCAVSQYAQGGRQYFVPSLTGKTRHRDHGWADCTVMDQLNRDGREGEHFDTLLGLPRRRQPAIAEPAESRDASPPRAAFLPCSSISLPDAFAFVAPPLPSRGHRRAHVLCSKQRLVSSFYPLLLHPVSRCHQQGFSTSKRYQAAII